MPRTGTATGSIGDSCWLADPQRIQYAIPAAVLRARFCQGPLHHRWTPEDLPYIVHRGRRRKGSEIAGFFVVGLQQCLPPLKFRNGFVDLPGGAAAHFKRSARDPSSNKLAEILDIRIVGRNGVCKGSAGTTAKTAVDGLQRHAAWRLGLCNTADAGKSGAGDSFGQSATELLVGIIRRRLDRSQILKAAQQARAAAKRFL